MGEDICEPGLENKPFSIRIGITIHLYRKIEITVVERNARPSGQPFGRARMLNRISKAWQKKYYIYQQMYMK